MGKATADKARKAAQVESMTVEVPEWGGTVTVRRAMLADSAWTREQMGPVDAEHEFDFTEYQLHLLARLIVEPDLGSEGAEILRTQPLGVMTLLLGAMNEVSGVTQADQFRPEDDAG